MAETSWESIRAPGSLEEPREAFWDGAVIKPSLQEPKLVLRSDTELRFDHKPSDPGMWVLVPWRWIGTSQYERRQGACQGLRTGPSSTQNKFFKETQVSFFVTKSSCVPCQDILRIFLFPFLFPFPAGCPWTNEFRRLLGQHTVSLSLEHRLTRSEQQTHPSARTTPGSWRRSSLSFWPLFSCGMEVSLEGCRLQSGHGKDRSQVEHWAPPCARWDVVPGTLHDPAISFYFVLEWSGIQYLSLIIFKMTNVSLTQPLLLLF